MVKRTRKEFKPYNAYQDRPFGLKWGTAFAMEELTEGIKENHQAVMRVNQPYPQMDRQAIDAVLQQAFQKAQPVAIQLNARDQHGHFVNEMMGHFYGEVSTDYICIDQQWVSWQDIRHIRLVVQTKWSD